MRPFQRNIVPVFGLCLAITAGAMAVDPPTMDVLSEVFSDPDWGFIGFYAVRNTSAVGSSNSISEFTLPAGANQAVFGVACPTGWSYSICGNSAFFLTSTNPILSGDEGYFELYGSGTDVGYRPATASSIAHEAFNPVAVLVPVIPVWGDEDRDGDVDADDFTEFEACASGPAVPYDPAATTSNGNLCSMFDADDDGDIDQSDFGRWEVCYSGEGNLSDCETESPYPPEPE